MILADLAWNVFNWTGPAFLTFYVLLLLVVVGVGYCLRQLGWQWEGPESNAKPDLNTREIALLAGGATRVVQGAVIEEIEAGRLQFAMVEIDESDPATRTKSKRTEQRLTPVSPPPAEADPTVLAIHEHLGTAGAPLWAVVEAVQPRVDAMTEKLTSLGLLRPFRTYSWMNFLPAALFAVFLTVGFIKLGLGVERGKNIQHLVLVILFGLIAGGIFLGTGTTRTWLGEQWLEHFRSTLPSQDVNAVRGNELAPAGSAAAALCFAILGAEVIGSADLRSALGRLGSPSGDGGSGCGGSSCGGGGGCGGGGCGGCGGGGGD